MMNAIVLLITLTFSVQSQAFDYFTRNTYENICESQGVPMSATGSKEICEIVVKNDVCAKVPKDDLLNCNKIDSFGITNYWDYTIGCTNGVFNFIGDTLSFIWEVMKWAGINAISSEARSESADAASEFMNSSKLYLHSEYEKAYAQASPPMKEAKALKGMGNSIGKLIYDQVSAQVASQYQEFGCLNSWARSEKMCQVLSEIFLPPAAVLAFLKHGPKAVSEFPQLKAIVAKVEPPKFSALLQTYPALGRTYATIGEKMPGSSLIKDPTEIPFEYSNTFRPVKADAMNQRALELDPEMKGAITAAYNSLNDPAHLKKYYQTLFEDAAEWLAKKGGPDDIAYLKEGKVSLHAIAVVVTKRMKERGEDFTTLKLDGVTTELKTGKISVIPEEVVSDNAKFRKAIETGPFFDRAFKNDERYGHGSYSHIIQRDIVHAAVSKETGGNPQKFYDFLGSKKGVNWWADLFDSGNKFSMTRPETVTQYIYHNLTPPPLN